MLDNESSFDNSKELSSIGYFLNLSPYLFAHSVFFLLNTINVRKQQILIPSYTISLTFFFFNLYQVPSTLYREC